MEHEKVPERAFVSASRKLVHGFSAVVRLSRGDFGIFDLRTGRITSLGTDGSFFLKYR
jgi:hypothetical protein